MNLIPVLMLLLFSSCTHTEADLLSGKVVAIADGDTFTLLRNDNKQLKIRLHGVDSPERGQDFGANAKQGLSSLIFGQTVRMEEKDTDRYGRTVAIVYTQANVCVNEQLLKDGWVWHYKEYDRNPVWDNFEREAKAAKKGLWAGINPKAPWLWRAQKRTKKSATVIAD